MRAIKFLMPHAHTQAHIDTHRHTHSTHSACPAYLAAIKAINFAMTLHYSCSLQPAPASPCLPSPSHLTPLSLSCQCFLHDLMRNFQNFANFSDNLSFLHQAKSSLLAPAVSTFSVCPSASTYLPPYLTSLYDLSASKNCDLSALIDIQDLPGKVARYDDVEACC